MSHHTRRRIKYAIIKKSTYFETPYLVELSSRANTALEDINLNCNLIAHPKNESHYLLKTTKCPSIFNNNSRLATMRELTRIVEDINNEEHLNEKCYLKMEIDIMIDEDVRKKIMERKIDGIGMTLIIISAYAMRLMQDTRKDGKQVIMCFLKIFIR